MVGLLACLVSATVFQYNRKNPSLEFKDVEAGGFQASYRCQSALEGDKDLVF